MPGIERDSIYAGSLPSAGHDRRHRLPRGNAPERAVRARAARACRAGSSARPRRSPAAERIILPGVGAARATIDSLAEQGLVDALTGAGARRRGPVPRHLHRPPGALRPQRGGRHRRASAGSRARCGASPTPAGSRRSAGTRCASPGRTRSPAALPDERALLLRELVLLRARPTRTTRSASPTTASSSARSSRATTSSPRSSTPRRAGRSGSRSCAASREWDGTC